MFQFIFDYYLLLIGIHDTAGNHDTKWKNRDKNAIWQQPLNLFDYIFNRKFQSMLQSKKNFNSSNCVKT